MRILHYYWSQFNDDLRKGGGVKVYLNNIIPYQVSNNDEVYMLNSGVDYSIIDNKCFIKNISNQPLLKQFSIYNSPIMAPSKADFYNTEAYLKDETLKIIFKNFILKYGPFDVIHFHSLEGISLPVLELKEEFSTTKFILSIHNYFCFCPEVNLWKNDLENCTDFHDGNDCVNCIGILPKRKSIKRYYQMITFFKDRNLLEVVTKVSKQAKNYYKKIKKGTKENNSQQINLCVGEDKKSCQSSLFYSFRNKNIEYINKYIDNILCVSRRVKEICANMGISKTKLHVLYIGTNFAKTQSLSNKFDINKDPFSVAYIGYMRHDKGFYFFLNSLAHMDNKLSRRIKVVVAAHNEDDEALATLMKLKPKFTSIKYYDGYTHNNINSILQDVQLGVVPVMWEDNLPQVAMELKAMGIPVLASDRGGASELSSAAEFKFKAGDTNDFCNKIEMLSNNRNLLKKYYDQQLVLDTVEGHCQKLLAFYRNSF